MAIEKTSVKDILDKNYAEFDLGLLCEEAYKSLKHIDMVVYTLLNNQHGLSVKTTLNGSKRYVDKNGFIFVSIGQDKLCKVLRTTRPTLSASLKRLQELDLIEVVNVGNMKCNKIYVGKLKRTLTLGDYMKNMNIEEEEQEEYTPKIDVLHIEEVKKIAENKKASSTAIDEASNNIKSSTSINSLYNKSIPQNNKKDTKKYNKNYKPNRFHNCKNKVLEYTEEELNEILEENEKAKKEKRECKENNVSVDIRNVEELVKKALLSKEYFEALESEYKNIVVDYILNNNMFKPFYMDNI